MSDEWDDRVVVVTGGAGGLGSAVAKLCEDAGARVWLVDRDFPDGFEMRSERMPADITSTADMTRVAAHLDERHGRCDALINCAAVLAKASLAEETEDNWDHVIGTNLKGAFITARTIGALMLRQRSGAIVNVASIAGHIPPASSGAYAVSKAGVLALTRQIALEWGPRGVRANSVSPGYMRTGMTSAVFSVEEAEADRASSTPLGRTAEVLEVARVVAFLASDRASFVTGVDVVVDGGALLSSALGFPGLPQP